MKRFIIYTALVCFASSSLASNATRLYKDSCKQAWEIHGKKYEHRINCYTDPAFATIGTGINQVCEVENTGEGDLSFNPSTEAHVYDRQNGGPLEDVSNQATVQFNTPLAPGESRTIIWQDEIMGSPADHWSKIELCPVIGGHVKHQYKIQHCHKYVTDEDCVDPKLTSYAFIDIDNDGECEPLTAYDFGVTAQPFESRDYGVCVGGQSDASKVFINGGQVNVINGSFEAYYPRTITVGDYGSSTVTQNESWEIWADNYSEVRTCRVQMGDSVMVKLSPPGEKPCLTPTLTDVKVTVSPNEGECGEHAHWTWQTPEEIGNVYTYQVCAEGVTDPEAELVVNGDPVTVRPDGTWIWTWTGTIQGKDIDVVHRSNVSVAATLPGSDECPARTSGPYSVTLPGPEGVGPACVGRGCDELYAIPTIGEWGFMGFVLLLGAFGVTRIRR